MAEPQAFLDQGPVAPPPDPDISYDPQGRPRITIRPTPGRSGTSRPAGGGGRSFGGSIEDAPAYVSPEEKRPTAQQSIEDAPAYVDRSMPAQPEREVSTGQALAQGVGAGVGLGFSPAIQGLQTAAQAPGGENTKQAVEAVQSGLETVNPFSRLAKMIGLPQDHETLQGLARLFQRGGDQPAQQAYVQGRDVAQETQDLAAKQHPGAFYPGMIAGTVALPVPGGPVAGAGRLANIGRGVATGAILGGTQGVGEGVSRGETAPEIASRAATGTVIGGAIGGPLGAILPGAARPAVTTGQRAAQTADQLLGEALPRGVTSDRPWIQSTTAAARQVPILGPRISRKVEKTAEAAGEHIEGVARGMTGGPDTRAAANALVQPAVREIIDNNKAAQNALYDGVRGMINRNAEFTMPRTRAALDKIIAERRAAHEVNPQAGLEQFESLATGATFEGAHRARATARNAGDIRNPTPGYDAGQYNFLTRAMTGDLEAMVHAAATNATPEGRTAALRAFRQAEEEFGRIAEVNKRLNKIAEAPGEGTIATLLGTAKEIKGDVRLLSELQRTMSPTEFQHLGGQLLFELGHMPSAPGGFSLSKFQTEWDKLSDRAKDIMFAPQHRADIERITEMASHIKGALKESSTSHSANLFVAFEMLKQMAAAVADLYTEGHGAFSAAAAASSGLTLGIAHWLGNPATARAISNWTTAYRAATLGTPTPARIAAFKIATRNLASNINLPVEDVMRIIQQRLPTAAEPSADNQRPKVPGPSR
jgi:hypothetical protein